MVSFAVQKLVSLIRSHLFIYLFLFLLPWKIDLRKYWYDLCQRMFCLCSLLGVLLHHIFLIQSSEHLGCFHVMTIIINNAMNTGMHVSFQIIFSI